MSWPSNQPPDYRRPSYPRRSTASMFLGRSDAPSTQFGQRGRSRVPIRLAVGILAALLLVGTVTHIGPAFRAGMHEGTRGSWIATSAQCSKVRGCIWQGKFVSSTGHVLLTKAQYAGQMPAHLRVGAALPAIDPGGSLVFPASGSDLWISLLVGLIVGAGALYWASHRWVAGYFQQRRAAEAEELRSVVP